MSGRFRIRTSHGQELSFASHEMFAEFVRSGELSPDDVVYDATTREWAPARTHPVVLQIELEAEETTRTSSAGAATSADEEDGGIASSRPVVSLDLAPEPAGPTPEEQAAAFVARMEAERAAEVDDEPPGGALKMQKGSSSILGDVAPPSAEAPVAPRWRPPAPLAEPPREEPIGRSVEPRHEAAIPAPVAPRRRTVKGRRRSYAPLVLLAAAVAAGA